MESLRFIGRNQTEKLLYEVAAEVAAPKAVADDGNRKDMIKDIRGLGRDYAQLQFKTQRAVRKIKSYGIAWKDAAEDFLKDGDVKELFHTLGNISETKDALEDANKKHNKIKLVICKFFITKGNVSSQIWVGYDR